MKFGSAAGAVAGGGRSREGAWIEISAYSNQLASQSVAPARERGLKSNANGKYELSNFGRSREGAWIEIAVILMIFLSSAVAPARERGLKWVIQQASSTCLRRSREGAWIEIAITGYKLIIVISSLPRGSVD